MAVDFTRDPVILDSRGIATAYGGAHVLRSAFQPVFALDGGRLAQVASEALLRCHAGDRPVPVARFFARVDRQDRPDIEALVHRLHLVNAAAVLPSSCGVFVNFDPSLFADCAAASAAIDGFATLADRLGFAPPRIVCEITEQESASEEALAAFTGALRERGFRIAVDDFGAQSSDMRRVAALRPDIVKLDQQWLWRLMDTRPGRSLITHMAGEFAALGIETVFEGIEQPWQLDVAADCGASMVQGFALAHPALAGEELAAPRFAAARSSERASTVAA